MSDKVEDATDTAQSACNGLLSRIEAQITKWAVKWLTWQLRKDKGFYVLYQANIAMAFYDKFRAHFTGKFAICPDQMIVDYCNDAANDFMDWWIKR